MDKYFEAEEGEENSRQVEGSGEGKKITITQEGRRQEKKNCG